MTSLEHTVRDFLAIPDVLPQFIEAISSGKISMKDLARALDSSFEPVKDVAANWGVRLLTPERQ